MVRRANEAALFVFIAFASCWIYLAARTWVVSSDFLFKRINNMFHLFVVIWVLRKAVGQSSVMRFPISSLFRIRS